MKLTYNITVTARKKGDVGIFSPVTITRVLDEFWATASRKNRRYKAIEIFEAADYEMERFRSWTTRRD